jgi:hypothetical protein
MRKTSGHFVRSKDEVKSSFEEFQLLVENYTGKMIILSSDNSKAYVHQVFQDYLKEKGIRQTPDGCALHSRTKCGC